MIKQAYSNGKKSIRCNPEGHGRSDFIGLQLHKLPHSYIIVSDNVFNFYSFDGRNNNLSDLDFDISRSLTVKSNGGVGTPQVLHVLL